MDTKTRPINTVDKRSTSGLGTHTEWKWENGKSYSMKMEIKAGVAILVSDKIYVKECNKRQRKAT